MSQMLKCKTVSNQMPGEVSYFLCAKATERRITEGGKLLLPHLLSTWGYITTTERSIRGRAKRAPI